MISDIKLLQLLYNQSESNHKMIMANYIPLICKLIFNEFSISYTKEDIEQYLSDEFLKVFSCKDGTYSQSRFNKVLLAIMAKRKVLDMYRRSKNNNQIPTDDVSTDLRNISDDILRSVLLKDDNSQLIDDLKSLNESDSEIITSKYSSNQSLRDISKKTGLRVSAYA